MSSTWGSPRCCPECGGHLEMWDPRKACDSSRPGRPSARGSSAPVHRGTGACAWLPAGDSGGHRMAGPPAGGRKDFASRGYIDNLDLECVGESSKCLNRGPRDPLVLRVLATASERVPPLARGPS